MQCRLMLPHSPVIVEYVSIFHQQGSDRYATDTAAIDIATDIVAIDIATDIAATGLSSTS